MKSKNIIEIGGITVSYFLKGVKVDLLLKIIFNCEE